MDSRPYTASTYPPRSPPHAMHAREVDLVVDIEKPSTMLQPISPPNPINTQRILTARTHVSGYQGYKPGIDFEGTISIVDTLDDEIKRGILGYTGYKPMDHPSRCDLEPQIPIVGYSGWYNDKVSGHLGKVELHHGPVSAPEDEPESDIYNLEEEKDKDDSLRAKSIRERRIQYREAITALNQRKISINTVLNEICQKLAVKYPGLAEKRIRILKPFQVLDKTHSGCVTARDFEHCLVALNIVLPWAELVGIQGQFDPDSTGMIAYLDFVQQICPALQNIK